MQFQDPDHQAPLPLWSHPVEALNPEPQDEPNGDALRARIDELELIVEDYEALLNELPELFERKFQQRLEPLMERYRLLARAQQVLGDASLPLIEEPAQRPAATPLPLLKRWRRARQRNRLRAERDAA